MLNEITVSINDLMLDPNNPRFKKNFVEEPLIPDEGISFKQSDVMRRFSTAQTNSNGEEDVTNISDLYESMRTIGYVPIDRIVVRKIENSESYLIIEGNRRISAIKNLLYDYVNRKGVFDQTQEREKFEAVKNSFEEIICMLLDTSGLSNEELIRKVSIILGLRHHGSLLEWDALPKAYNIYKEYMSIEPKTTAFEFSGKKRNEVSSRLSISKGKVDRALSTYVAYLQLAENYEVKDRHYSLIQEIVTNKNLRDYYIHIDKKTYQLDEVSLEEFNKVCQFATRDRIASDKKKILTDPKKVQLLGRLFQKKQQATHQAIKSYANDVIMRALDEDDLEMTLDAAVDDLTNFESRTFWVDTVEKLLDKQEKELKVSDYRGTGNDLGSKEELERTIKPLKAIMGF